MQMIWVPALCVHMRLSKIRRSNANGRFHQLAFSSIDASFISFATSSAASFSCDSSVSASAVPFTDWFAAAGFFEVSCVLLLAVDGG